jgi:hypothetical protein
MSHDKRYVTIAEYLLTFDWAVPSDRQEGDTNRYFLELKKIRG